MPNEILNPYVSETDRRLISKVSIKLLIDIYTLSEGSKIFNYIEFNKDASEVTNKPIIDKDNYTITFTGNPPSYTKSINIDETNANNVNLINKSITDGRIKLNCDCEHICISFNK
jgi:hypothetical protein